MYYTLFRSSEPLGADLHTDKEGPKFLGLACRCSKGCDLSINPNDLKVKQGVRFANLNIQVAEQVTFSLDPSEFRCNDLLPA